jgi:hypothetical protein
MISESTAAPLIDTSISIWIRGRKCASESTGRIYEIEDAEDDVPRAATCAEGCWPQKLVIPCDYKPGMVLSWLMEGREQCHGRGNGVTGVEDLHIMNDKGL